MAKTIFVTSFFGLIARNILSTDVLKILRGQAGLRIVVLTPENKKEQYQKRFGGENVIIEGVKIQNPSKLGQFFATLFNHLSDSAAWKIHRLIYRKRTRNYPMAAIYWSLSKLGYLKIIRGFARWLEFRLLPKNKYKEYFERYRPDLVFATDVFQENDLDVMREAKKRGIFALGMVRSWDNVTTKGLNRIIPDRLIVNTEKIKEDAVKYNDIKPENIYTVGIPHYDRYVLDKRSPKEEVFRKLNLDPNKKTIFFAPPGEIYTEGNPVNHQVIRALTSLDAQLLIRPYLVGRANLENIKSIPGKLAIDDPGSGSDFLQADLTAGDAHLADVLHHSDVVVAFASTLAIDAIAFNKPVVFVGFDGDTRPYWKSLRRFYDYDHQKSILKTGGVKLARNPEELVRFVGEYLANPSLDDAGRKRIIEERCWKLDGKSGERLASIILDKVLIK